MRIVSLGSGSKGNAYVVDDGRAAVLIDCGLNYKTLVARLTEAGLGDASYLSSRLQGVLLTHSHGDHCAGLGVLLNKHPALAVYANAMTAETVAHEAKIDDEAFVCFENGQPFELGPFAVHAFSIPHDTADPVGYCVTACGAEGPLTYFHGTDIGTPLDSIGVQLAGADVATLESNHDPAMLRASGRPPHIVQRIAGPRGHLSNDQSAELIRRFATARLKRLALAHLSHDCNAAHLAEGTMRAALREIGRADIGVTVLEQDRPVEV